MKEMNWNRKGNVSYGVRRKTWPPLFGGGVIPPHPKDVLFVATAAPVYEQEEEFRVVKGGNFLYVSGPQIERMYFGLDSLPEASKLCLLLAHAYAAGRERIAAGM